uniref:Methyltransferase type 11 domain-containing protein n=1 Tax=Amphora coffeiformis TaxID=265554 RepID=A0A6S8JX34_9STRA
MTKLESPSAERNRGPIWDLVVEARLLKDVDATTISTPLNALEVAAGSGVHTQFFAQQLASRKILVTWQSTDPEASALASQEAYIEEIAGPSSKSDEDKTYWRTCETVNFGKPLALTLDENGIRETSTESAIADQSMDWIWTINMIHISPWAATQGLMKMAGTKLKPKSGRLILYGPYRVNGFTVESNLKFEEWLKAKDSSYGVRNLEDVVAEASKHGLELEDTIEMPANNLSVILRKRG